jgi:hypothetical protein
VVDRRLLGRVPHRPTGEVARPTLAGDQFVERGDYVLLCHFVRHAGEGSIMRRHLRRARSEQQNEHEYHSVGSS